MTTRTITIITASLASSLALAGCSTVVNGTNQKLAVATVDAVGAPVTGADCVATGGSSRPKTALNRSFATPADIRVRRSRKPIEIQCTYGGQGQGTMVGETTIRGNFETATAGNLVIGGILGAGLDGATGAIYNYPKSVLVTMGPAGAVGAVGSAASAPPADIPADETTPAE